VIWLTFCYYNNQQISIAENWGFMETTQARKLTCQIEKNIELRYRRGLSRGQEFALTGQKTGLVKTMIETIVSANKILGISIFAIGFSAWLGYVFDHESWYRWHNYETALSINAAIAFTFVGIDLFFISWRLERLERLENDS